MSYCSCVFFAHHRKLTFGVIARFICRRFAHKLSWINNFKDDFYFIFGFQQYKTPHIFFYMHPLPLTLGFIEVSDDLDSDGVHCEGRQRKWGATVKWRDFNLSCFRRFNERWPSPLYFLICDQTWCNMIICKLNKTFQFVLDFERCVLVSCYFALSKSFDSDERLWQNWTFCLHLFRFSVCPYSPCLFPLRKLKTSHQAWLIIYVRHVCR